MAFLKHPGSEEFTSLLAFSIFIASILQETHHNPWQRLTATVAALAGCIISAKHGRDIMPSDLLAEINTILNEEIHSLEGKLAYIEVPDDLPVTSSCLVEDKTGDEIARIALSIMKLLEEFVEVDDAISILVLMVAAGVVGYHALSNIPHSTLLKEIELYLHERVRFMERLTLH